MKRLFGLFLCIGLAVVAMTFAGCGGVDLYVYMNAGKFSAINSGATYTNVQDITIDWLVGSVTIKSGSVSEVTIKEKGSKASENPGYIRQFNNGNASIKYFKSGSTRDTSIEKDLEIIVPTGTALKGLNIVAISARVVIENVTCNDVYVSNNKGTVDFRASNFSTAKIVSGSGEINVTGCAVEYSLTLNPNTSLVNVTDTNAFEYLIYTYKSTINLELADESFILLYKDNGECLYPDFELVDDGEGGLVYGDAENILHKVSFEATHDRGTLNISKNVGQPA